MISVIKFLLHGEPVRDYAHGYTHTRVHLILQQSKIHVLVIRVETFHVNHFDANEFCNSHSYRSG